MNSQTKGNDMYIRHTQLDFDNDEIDEQELDMEEELYYDRPDVIAGEVFQDKLDTFRAEY
jgi:hypothetical protein